MSNAFSVFDDYIQEQHISLTPDEKVQLEKVYQDFLEISRGYKFLHVKYYSGMYYIVTKKAPDETTV